MKRNAFTLLELLVVIAITAMLLGILLPVMRAAKKQAQAVRCSSNLSQIALMMAMYDNQNGTFPCGFYDGSMPPGGHIGDASLDYAGWWWFHYIIEGKSKESVAWCPSRIAPDAATKKNILCLNYGVNRSICKDALGLTGTLASEFTGKPLGQAQIRNPSKTLLATDSGYSLVSWKAATNDVSPRFDNQYRENFFYIPGMSINMDQPLSIPNMPYDAKVRHVNKTVNIIYTDGHLERVKADKLAVKNTGGDYKTLPTLWKPQ